MSPAQGVPYASEIAPGPTEWRPPPLPDGRRESLAGSEAAAFGTLRFMPRYSRYGVYDRVAGCTATDNGSVS